MKEKSQEKNEATQADIGGGSEETAA